MDTSIWAVCGQNMIIALGSIVNMREGGNSHETLHFHIEWSTHMSSKNYDTNDYGAQFGLLIISH